MIKKMSDERCKGIGRNLKKFREEKGWTQEELAEKADVHVSYIGQIERGLRYPSLKVLFKIADALHIIENIERGIHIMKTVTRKEAIKALIEDDFLNRIRNKELHEILLYGFKGYKNMSDEEIKYLYLELHGVEEKTKTSFTF